MVNQNNKRNSFVALCDYASQNNWCWKIICTTCGHSAFKVSFAKIAKGQNPDQESFWLHGKRNHEPLKEMEQYRDFIGGAKIDAQIKFASIVAEAKLSELQSVAKFPDWLGYIGLVIHHCPDHEARRILSKSFLPQFIEMLKDDKEICDYLKNRLAQQGPISVNDLSRIENKGVDLKNPPMPLIFDIL